MYYYRINIPSFFCFFCCLFIIVAACAAAAFVLLTALVALGAGATAAAAAKPWPSYSLQNMPHTGFACRGKILGGYYADAETQCQMFHVCVKVAGVGVSVVFSQVVQRERRALVLTFFMYMV